MTVALIWTKQRFRCIRYDGDIDVKIPSDTDLSWQQYCVYVISFRTPYFVKYLKGTSPVCYIGSGTAWRLKDHKGNWLCKISTLLTELESYEIWRCAPQGGRRTRAFRDVEVDFVTRFIEKYGERPLFNRRLGNFKFKYKQKYDQKTLHKFDQIYMKQSGVSYSIKLKSQGTQSRGY
jgi:hypothetical protein